MTSRIHGFSRMSPPERQRELARVSGLDAAELAALCERGGLPMDLADQMIENAIGVFGVPLGVALNFVVNGRERLVPMAVEESSVIAAASLAAKIARGCGGFRAEADRQTMIGQIQLTGVADAARARAALQEGRGRILEAANALHPRLVERGGGAFDLELRALGDMMVVHLYVDTLDAMGANIVNTMAEGVAPLIAEMAGGRVRLRILSNLADRRLARASVSLPVGALESFGLSGEEVAEGVLDAYRLAACDPYRAATHNKGIMNGVDAVALATGNDWRALEAGAHAFAAREGTYRPLTRWWVEDATLHGTIELPVQVGVVGGAARIHPLARVALRLLGAERARDLAEVMAAVGLAQNFAAMRALGTVGIQEGHMALHARVRGR